MVDPTPLMSQAENFFQARLVLLQWNISKKLYLRFPNDFTLVTSRFNERSTNTLSQLLQRCFILLLIHDFRAASDDVSANTSPVIMVKTKLLCSIGLQRTAEVISILTWLLWELFSQQIVAQLHPRWDEHVHHVFKQNCKTLKSFKDLDLTYVFLLRYLHCFPNLNANPKPLTNSWKDQNCID